MPSGFGFGFMTMLNLEPLIHKHSGKIWGQRPKKKSVYNYNTTTKTMPVFKQTHQKKLTEKKIQKKKTSSMGMLFVSKWWCPHCHFTTTNQCPISIPTLTTTGPQSTVSILLYHFLKLITESLIFIFTSCITVSDHHYFHLTSTQLDDGAVGQTMSGKCFLWFFLFISFKHGWYMTFLQDSTFFFSIMFYFCYL